MSVKGPGFCVPHYKPVFTSGATASVVENTTAVMTVTAVSPDAHAVMSYSVVGGVDVARFSINSSSGALTFNTAPDFEVPIDSGANNVYNVQVRATSVGLGQFTNQSLTITVTNVNDNAPVFESFSDPAAFTGDPFVITVVASDADGDAVTYTIVGGVDAGQFNIDLNSGDLNFNSPPDSGAPTDSDADNVYLVTVRASDGVHHTDQDISVTVF